MDGVLAQHPISCDVCEIRREITMPRPKQIAP